MTVQIIPFESREKWLTDRQNFLTATDIGRLANGGPAARVAVKAEKHGTGNSFRGNRYTEYGNEREPVILDRLGFLYDIEPNNALYVNGTRAATPDGVKHEGGELVQLAEVKTTVTDWWDDTQAETLANIARREQKYLDQVYWAQLVGEVGETVFAWEPHHNFIPGETRRLIIPRDEERIAYLLEVEAAFMEFWQNGEADDEWTAYMARYTEAEQALKVAEERMATLKDEVRERGGDGEVIESTPFGLISLKWPKPSARLDSIALKKAHPDIAEQFTKTTAPKQQTLRITTK